MRAVILGCGSVGANVARSVAADGDVDQLVVADVDGARASALAKELDAESSEFDAADLDSVAKVLKGADLVFNAVGPHYRFCVPLVEAAITAGANYVDINDDFDVAAELVRNPRYDEAARSAGVTVIIGAGTTPGITNVLARWAYDQLDRTDAVRVAWAIPFMTAFSPAVTEHMFHILGGDVIEFLDGDYRRVPAGSGERMVDLLPPFGTYRFAYSGHGEAVTLPKFLPGLREATVRSAFFQDEGNKIYQRLIAFGFGNGDQVPGVGLSPRGFMAHYMATETAQVAMSMDTSDAPQGAVFQVEVEGSQQEIPTKIIYEMHMLFDGREEAAGDPTAYAAATTIHEVVNGRVTTPGLLAPEACLDPTRVVPSFLKRTGARLYRRFEQVTDVGSD